MPMETAPGRTKALRQPAVSMSQPVSSAATATPKFPKTPLIASGIPVFCRPCTTIARPTGW